MMIIPVIITVAIPVLTSTSSIREHPVDSLERIVVLDGKHVLFFGLAGNMGQLDLKFRNITPIAVMTDTHGKNLQAGIPGQFGFDESGLDVTRKAVCDENQLFPGPRTRSVFGAETLRETLIKMTVN